MKRILVVDDEPTNTLLVKRCLESVGNYEVFTENRGSLAVQAARKHHPHLILLDIMMPDMPGSDVAAALHEDSALRHIKVVFLTSMIAKGQETRSGKDIVMAKPISTKELVAVIEQELGQSMSDSTSIRG